MTEARRLPDRTTARAWCRVDLAGGTLDIWPLGLLHEGARTVNVAIDVEARVELGRRASGFRIVQGESVVEADEIEALLARRDTALAAVVLSHLGIDAADVRLASDSPRGGGLGASSALAVALLAAGERLMGGSPAAPTAVAATARDLEARLMGRPTGTQDHYPALVGGALDIRYLPGGDEVVAVPADLAALGDCLLVAYTGQSHLSGDTNWQMVRRRLDGEPEVTELFEGIARVAAALAESLTAGDLEGVGGLMAQEWSLRRRLAPGISTPEIEALLESARAAGAWGGKACGAGGGGCVAVLGPAERREAIGRALREGGAELLFARPAAGGVDVRSI